MSATTTRRTDLALARVIPGPMPTIPPYPPRIGMGFAAIKASLPPGERICALRPDGTLVLRRDDWTVGDVPGALYMTHPGNAVMDKSYAVSRAEGN